MAEHGGDKTALNGAQFKCCRRINVNEGNLINKVNGKENSTTKNCLDHIQVSKISTGKIIVNNTRLLKSRNVVTEAHHPQRQEACRYSVGTKCVHVLPILLIF